jgi:RimJ/RimL family protein N-acetyltransferase
MEDVASPEAERRFLRYFWAALADWRPERWNLMLAARAGGDIVGVQEIGAQHFELTRTVSTGSWLGRRYQGAGYGKAVREAVASGVRWSSWRARGHRGLGYQPCVHRRLPSDGLSR